MHIFYLSIHSFGQEYYQFYNNHLFFYQHQHYMYNYMPVNGNFFLSIRLRSWIRMTMYRSWQISPKYACPLSSKRWVLSSSSWLCDAMLSSQWSCLPCFQFLSPAFQAHLHYESIVPFPKGYFLLYPSYLLLLNLPFYHLSSHGPKQLVVFFNANLVEDHFLNCISPCDV